MKILAVADKESKALWEYYDPSMLADVDLILSCGDLDRNYLEFLVTMAHCPLFYVHGNHDGDYETDPPEGCECIEDSIVRYKGLRILGLGGSMRYKEGPFLYTEQEMGRRVFRARLSALFRGQPDIVVTHAPVCGWGDMEDLPHRGFACFEKLLTGNGPRYLLHGHVHKSYGSFTRMREHPSGTILVNAWQYCFLEV